MTKLTTEKTAMRKSEAANPATTKLTNVQRTFLSLAAEREDGAGAVPEGMTEKAAKKLAATLIEKGLVREVRAKADMPIWRRYEKPHFRPACPPRTLTSFVFYKDCAGSP